MTVSTLLGKHQVTAEVHVSSATFWKSARREATSGPPSMLWMTSSKVWVLSAQPHVTAAVWPQDWPFILFFLWLNLQRRNVLLKMLWLGWNMSSESLLWTSQDLANVAARQNLFSLEIPKVSVAFGIFTTSILVFDTANCLVLLLKNLLGRLLVWRLLKRPTPTLSWHGLNLRRNQGFRTRLKAISLTYGRQTPSNGPAVTPAPSSQHHSVWKASNPWICTGWG